MKLPHLYYLERYRNKGTRTYSDHASYTDASTRYRPESDQEQFGLNVFDMPMERVNVYTANPAALEKQFVRGNTVNFCIHPQVIEVFPGDKYVRLVLSNHTQRTTRLVAPSSSTRSLFVLNQEQPHAVKVHFPFKISRYTRKMRDEVVEQSILVSQDLEEGIDKMAKDFAFLREVIGITLKNIESGCERQENWGFLVRDMTPFPIANEPSTLIPGFALYGEDYYDPEISPLLFELIGTLEPVRYILDQIMLPIMHHWIECFRHFGYILEPHGQNVLLEVDSKQRIRRIVHRDLSVGIDMRRRRDLKLSSHHLNDYNRMEDNAFHSIAFDRFMGSHFFDRIVKACIDHYPGVCESDFTQPCKVAFAKHFPEYRDYLPKNVWYFSEQRDQYNKPLFYDTGEVPKWRPGG